MFASTSLSPIIAESLVTADFSINGNSKVLSIGDSPSLLI
jgi:hypothetical protein